MSPNRIALVMLTFVSAFLIAPSIASQNTNQKSSPNIPVLHNPDVAGQGRAKSSGQTTPLQATSVENGLSCTTITFEGVGNLSGIPDFDGISSPGWLGIIDADAGGSGNFAFEPSPETIAFWLGGAPGSRDIVFTTPVAKVEFLYSSFVTVQLEAFDEAGNVIATATGPANFNQGPGGDPTGDFNKWDPLKVEAMGNKITRLRVSGNVNQTGIDNLKVCKAIGIHSVEVTQAIQEWQDIDELKTDLQSDREPPVPIVEGKPAVLRVYLDQLQAVTDVRIEISGVTNQSKSLTIQPQCTPELYRRGERGCQSVDFYFVPPSGQWQATIKLFDSNNMMIESHDLPFRSRDADSLVLRSVSICDAKDNAGNWLCAQGSGLAGLIDFLQRTAPTDTVRVSTTNHFVRKDIATYGDVDDWWTDTIRDVHNKFNLFDAFAQLFGERRFYYGLIRPALPGGTGGMAHAIPSRGAGSRSSVIRLGVEAAAETVAHETGHMLGRRHTNTGVPAASGGSPPGCYNTAVDPSTDWPFSDNRIRSSRRLEVGFDISARRAVIPENTFDWMGYCTPRWISPHTYRNVMNALGAANAASTAKQVSTTTGLFWNVSGTIINSSVVFDALFESTTQGPDNAGAGSYRIEVRASNGSVIFTRLFTPNTPATESGAGELTGPPVFFELIPVIANASAIVVINPGGAEIGQLQLGGTVPAVNIIFPKAGATLSGVQQVAWSVSDPDSTTHTARVLYSADGGKNWVSLGEVAQANSLPVDFDAIPGSAGSSKIMVSVSDGINTGNEVSGLFSVSKKTPSADIISPVAATVFRQQDLVWLRGVAYDVDDGFLDGKSIRWESNQNGILGTGAILSIMNLTVGSHTITMTATDGDGNTASKAVTIRVAGAPPTVNLTVRPLNVLPTTCVEVTIDAHPGSVELGVVEYSLNGGATWNTVPLNQLPFRFLVPGQGFFHLVARSIDVAQQAAAKDSKFFIDSICQNLNNPPVARCQNIVVSAGTQCTATASINNGSFDPDGDPITLTQSPPGPYPLGNTLVTLTVTDDEGASNTCTATVTVVDTTQPTITCPSNMIKVAQKPGDSSVIVSFPQPASSDNCPGVTVACTPASGSAFPVGTTTVSCKAVDTSGNMTPCSFTVTVYDVRLQHDSDPARVLLFMSSGPEQGRYRLCCGGNAFTGVGTVRIQGRVFTLEHHPPDRRVLASCDANQGKGTASLQSPPGNTICTITDRDIGNNNSLCP